METLIEGLLGCVSSLVNVYGQEQLLKYPKQLLDLQTQLQTERAKGYDSDDAKIEALYAQMQLVQQALQNDIAMLQAGKAGTSAPVASAASAVVAAVK